MDNSQTSNPNGPITISVILPVYNVAHWIDECIESLKKQTLPGLEFIFVDDCSTDGSIDIIKAFASEDSRVRFLQNQVNSGSGPSRNAGIEAAQGEYYSFIDPDDWIGDDFYTLLYEKAKKSGCDIVKGIRVGFQDGDNLSRLLTEKTDSKLNKRIRRQLKKNWPLYYSFTHEHQSAIYKASLFEVESVRYGFSRAAQDVTFLLKICYNTDNIAFQEGAIYYYRQRAGAVTSSYTIKRALAHMQSVGERAAYLKNKPGFPSRFHSKYLVEKLKGAHNLYYYATKEQAISSLELEEYRQCTCSIMEILGDSNQFLHSFPEMEIYSDYSHCIPSVMKKGDHVFRDGVIQWTEFFQKYPEARKSAYYRGFAISVLRTINSFRKARYESVDSRKTGLHFIKEQLNKLSRKDRCRVLIHIPASGISEVLKRTGL